MGKLVLGMVIGMGIYLALMIVFSGQWSLLWMVLLIMFYWIHCYLAGFWIGVALFLFAMWVWDNWLGNMFANLMRWATSANNE